MKNLVIKGALIINENKIEAKDILIEKESHIMSKESLLYKCVCSPFERKKFNYKIDKTFFNGQIACENNIANRINGQRISFNY